MTEPPVESLARRFVDAFNRRDPNGLLAVCHPEIDFYPTGAGGTGRAYHGHDGIRAWAADLARGDMKHEAQIREVRALDADRVVVSCEVVADGVVITPSVLVGVVADGLLTEVRGYLTDVDTVLKVHGIPE